MTALCGGGASGPTFGAAAVTDLSAASLALLFENSGIPWLIPAIPVIGLAPLVLSAFCATDPPAMPVLTSAESNAVVKLIIGPDFTSGIAKVADIARIYAWHQLCVCTGMATPAPPAAPAPPAGTPILTQPAFSAWSLCGVQGVIAPQSAVVAGGNNFAGFTFATTPNLQMFRVHAIRTSIGAGPHQNSSLTLFWGTGAPTFQETVATIPPDGVERTFDFALRPGYTTMNQVGLTAAANSTDTYNAWVELFCGAPGGSSTGCCPPDPATQAILNVLLNQVNLLQRQLVPFAYVTGTAHVGIAGTGTIAVQGLIGVKINVTAYPAGNTVIPGEPSYIYDLGWVSIETPDGFIDEQRIRNTNQLWMPRMMSEATKLGYYLRAGVTATFTELVREP